MPRRKKASVQDIASQKQASLQGKMRQTTEDVLSKIASGEMVDDFISDMRKFGKNEFGDPIKWGNPHLVEETLRLVGDLRIARKYVSGCSQYMKGHPNTDLVCTPDGYKLVGDVKVGDYFIDEHGLPTEVIGIHPLGEATTYLVGFKDGTEIEVTDEHLWTWYSPNAHAPSKLKDGKAKMFWTNTTEELLQDAIDSGGFRRVKADGKPGGYKYAIPMITSPLSMDNGWDCEGMNPYLLGLLIGDGNYSHSAVTLTSCMEDLEFYQPLVGGIIRENKNRTPHINLTKTDAAKQLAAMGIRGQSRQAKRIPEKCFSMHWEKRLELLRGLMDSDGTNRSSSSSFCSVVKPIAEGVAKLVRELGGYAKVFEYERDTCIYYDVFVSLPEYLVPFKLPRKALAYTRVNTGKQIKAIEYIKPCRAVESTCFTVANPTSLYVCPEAIVTHNTFSCAQANAFFSQRAGLRGLWSFPKARTMELLVPKQHKALLRNYAKVAGVTKITREMMTSNAQFDVGLGSATFTHVNSNEGGASAAAGTSVVAVTADYVFAEEASQSSHNEILPLYRRVDASRISTRPVTWLGTPGGGGGIEAKIADATYEFWPHAKCPHCDASVSLHPLGALLKSQLTRAEDGTLITLWAHEDGTPLDWHHHDDLDPIGSAFVGCVECGKEISDEARINAHYKCIRTGLFMMEFLNDVVPALWQEEQLEVGVWVGALARPRKGIAKEIMAEMSPEGIDDWYQQRLGIPSSAMANSIPKEALMNACMRTPFKPNENEKTIRLLGIDQGRSAWYGAVVEFVYNPNLPPAAMYHNAKRNILALECFPYMATGEFVERFEVQGGIIDNEPSIAAAAAICRHTGLKLGDQQAKLKDDYQIKMAKDGGEQFECFSLKYKKYFRFIFSLFAGSSVSVQREYLRFASGKVKTPGDIFKHLCRIEWDAENGDVVKARDGVDDLAFALMFAEAAFGIYTVNPGLVSREGYSWDWFSSW